MLGVAESGWILGKHLSTSKRGKNETLVIDLICQSGTPNSLPGPSLTGFYPLNDQEIYSARYFG